jgi:hypothetical protein
MTQAFTAKNWLIDRAPRRIELLGDKTRRPEPAQHVIEFPGGAIEVSRTTNGCYWAHIIVNRGWWDADQEGLRSARGEIQDSRMDREGIGVHEIDGAPSLAQIAVLIRPVHGQLEA